MLKGFSSINHIQLYWKIYEDKYPQSENQQDYQILIETLIEVYSHIIEYQTSAVCHLSKAQLSRAWENVAGSNDWDCKAEKIKKLSQDCKELIHLSKDEELSERWKGQLEAMQRSEKILYRIVNILSDNGMQIQTNYEDQQERSLFQELASNYSGDKDFNPRRLEGTCEWVFKDDQFRRWRDDNTSGLFWLSAGPGCGKSVLSRALIDERRLSTNVTTSTICHFFFKDGDERRQHSTDALCAILHQLFAQDSSGSLIRKALGSHKTYGKSLTQNFSKLWQILLDCSRSSDAGEVICVLDALDECDGHSRGELIDRLEELYCRNHPSKLKFFITGRPYNNLEARFRRFSDKPGYQHLNGDDKSEEIGKEINLYIDHWVQNFTEYKDEDRCKISDFLKHKENRTYLWLHLTIEGIEQSSKRAMDILDILKELSEEVSDKYEKILDRSKEKDRTKILLQIVLSAEESLTLDQANVAMALALRDKEIVLHTELDLWPNFKAAVTELCGLFISIHDNKLFFIHQTAREFLLSSEHQNGWKGCLSMTHSHRRILRSCLDYLLLQDMPDERPLVLYSDIQYDDTKYPFLEYAAKNWPRHFSRYFGNSSAESDEEVSDLALSLCDLRPKPHKVWYIIYCSHHEYSPEVPSSSLLIAAYSGLEALVKQLLDTNKADINSKDTLHGRTALSWAAVNGHETVVEQLLRIDGVDVNSKDNNGDTPLSLAVCRGHEAIVKQLLNTGEVDVNLKNSDNITPLFEAAIWGHEAVVKYLLSTGKVDVNSKNIRGDTPLSGAAFRGHEVVVKQLLDACEVDVDLKDNYSDTPLFRAASRGHKAVVKQLLDTGKVDINSKNRYDETPLFGAVFYGHDAVVQQLLDTGKVDVDSSDSLNKTPLSIAVSLGHKVIIKQLLDTGKVDVESKDNKGRTPLSLAQEHGYTAIVEHLQSYRNSQLVRDSRGP